MTITEKSEIFLLLFLLMFLNIYVEEKKPNAENINIVGTYKMYTTTMTVYLYKK